MSQATNGTPPGMPRWVKVLGIITLIFVILLGVILLSGGEHGPNMHLPPVQHSTQQP